MAAPSMAAAGICLHIGAGIWVHFYHDLRVRTAPCTTTRGRAACGRSHRSGPAVPAGPRVTRPDRRPSTREAHRRGDGRAEARSRVLATQRTGAYTPPIPIEFPIAYHRWLIKN
jgi:hypothetical protein